MIVNGVLLVTIRTESVLPRSLDIITHWTSCRVVKLYRNVCTHGLPCVVLETCACVSFLCMLIPSFRLTVFVSARKLYIRSISYVKDTHVRMHLHVHTHAHMHSRLHAHIQNARTYTRTHARIHTCTHACTHTHTHTRARARAHSI